MNESSVMMLRKELALTVFFYSRSLSAWLQGYGVSTIIQVIFL
jgi:hypothetical protein